MNDAQTGLLRIEVEVDLRKNTLAVDVSGFGLDPGAVCGDELEGILDIGTRGQLIGIEIGDQYLAISDPVRGTEHLTRSVDVLLSVDRDPDGNVNQVTFRRSGDQYEISFPSGNQCWRVGSRDTTASRSVCPVVTA